MSGAFVAGDDMFSCTAHDEYKRSKSKVGMEAFSPHPDTPSLFCLATVNPVDEFVPLEKASHKSEPPPFDSQKSNSPRASRRERKVQEHCATLGGHMIGETCVVGIAYYPGCKKKCVYTPGSGYQH